MTPSFFIFIGNKNVGDENGTDNGNMNSGNDNGSGGCRT